MITRTIRGLFLTILMLPRWFLSAYTAWQQRRPGPTRYIKGPTPEEIAQAWAASQDPNNPMSFVALAEKSHAKAEEAKARATELGEWEHHIAETGIHPLADDQTCGCPARHIPETSTPYQIPETTEKD